MNVHCFILRCLAGFFASSSSLSHTFCFVWRWRWWWWSSNKYERRRSTMHHRRSPTLYLTPCTTTTALHVSLPPHSCRGNTGFSFFFLFSTTTLGTVGRLSCSCCCSYWWRLNSMRKNITKNSNKENKGEFDRHHCSVIQIQWLWSKQHLRRTIKYNNFM